MTSGSLSLVRLGRSLADGWCAMTRASVRGESLLLPGAALGIGGEPFADMNWACVYGPEGVDEAVRRVVSRLRERGLPAFISVTSPVASEAEVAAGDLGLRRSHPLPLMVLRAAEARRADAGFAVRRVTDLAGVREAALVAGEAFGIPVEACVSMFGPLFAELDAADLFLACHHGAAVAVAGAARAGPAVGLYAVGTRLAHRRKGAGSAAVSAAIDHHIRAGAHLFTLLAEPDAERFYAERGFVVVDRTTTWQVPA